MRFIISGKNIDITPGLRSSIEQKLGKLERFFTPETEIIVTLSVEKERQKIEVTIPMKGTIIRWSGRRGYWTPTFEIQKEAYWQTSRKRISPRRIHRNGGWFWWEWDSDYPNKEIRYEANVSRRCLYSNGTVGT